MTKMSPLPERSLAKAIFVPSADQAGRSLRGVVGQVRLLGAVGADDEDFGSDQEERCAGESDAAPSGDQAGALSVAGSFVTFVCPVPSAFMTKTSRLPPRKAAESNVRAVWLRVWRIILLRCVREVCLAGAVGVHDEDLVVSQAVS